VAVQFSRCAGALVRNGAEAREAACQQIVGRALDRPCRRGIGRSAMWRTILEATVSRRVVRRRDDDPVGQPARPRPVVAKDGMRDERRWCKTLVGIDHRCHAAGDQHLDHRAQRGSRQCVRVDTDEQRAVDAARPAIGADRLRDREDVRLVEGIVEGRAAVTRRPEADALGGLRDIGATRMLGAHECQQVDERTGRQQFAGAGIDICRHRAMAPRYSVVSQAGRESCKSCRRHEPRCAKAERPTRRRRNRRARRPGRRHRGSRQ